MKKNKKTAGKNKTRKSTEYKPTIAEQRLIEIILNPEHRLESITKICELAKCDRHTYYKAFKKEGFVKYIDKEVSRLIDKGYPSVINASLRQAMRGDSAHTKIILQMKGVLVDKHAIVGKDGKPQNLPQQPQLSELEIARRVSNILKIGLKRKKEAEEKAKSDG